MKQPPTGKSGNQPQRFDPEDAVGGALDALGRFAFWGGIVGSLVCIGLILFLYQSFAGSSAPGSPQQAVDNINLISKLFYISIVGSIIGSTYMFWGEEVLGVLQLMASGLLWSTPFFVPSMLGSGGQYGQVTSAALASLNMGGVIALGLSLCVLIADIVARVRQRAKQGARADAIKFGKGVKEERDVRNVFMGKCWQLPFCRKFVRESCPIYHSRRTCWKERVGCMCEEEVIRKAMEGRPIPKDMVAAARFIPYNNKIPMAAKQERCRQCVIYNEHQKHKYKLSLWVTLGTFGLIYVGLHAALLAGVGGLIGSMDAVFRRLTFSQNGLTSAVQTQASFFQEFLLFCIVMVVLAYSLKLLEFLIFKVKV